MDRSPFQRRGFTLIELLVVIAIAGVVMTIGIPSFMRSMEKGPLAQADSDVIEACSHARAQAVFTGRPAELLIRPRQRQFIVEPAPRESDQPPGMVLAASGSPGRATSTPVKTIFSATLSDEITIEMVDINLQEYKDASEARVRFYPNGTAEELTVVLQHRGSAYHKIAVDMVTGLADMEVIK